MDQNFWKKCSSCKKEIGFRQKYFLCSVSTCQGLRTGYVFCSVPCFERHLPGARHKSAGAIEKFSPHTAELASDPQPIPTEKTPQRILIRQGPSSGPPGVHAPQEVLIIASRLKEYISARSEFNTSAAVMDVLSDHVRELCDRAIDEARKEGRKTVLERDFDFLKGE